MLRLSLEFTGESAFQMSKSLTLFGMFIDALGQRFSPFSAKYIDLYFANTNTDYAEVPPGILLRRWRNQLTQNLDPNATVPQSVPDHEASLATELPFSKFIP
jgi:hypothetical protein